jgi:thioredoxin 1
MKPWRNYVVWFICVVFGLLAVWHPLPAQAQGSTPPKGKPTLYEFGAHWCIPCREMKQVMADLKASHGDQVEFRMVYVDEEKPLFGEYKIVAIPTQVFLDSSGKEVDRHLGALTKEEVLKKLKELKFIR